MPEKIRNEPRRGNFYRDSKKTKEIESSKRKMSPWVRSWLNRCKVLVIIVFLCAMVFVLAIGIGRLFVVAYDSALQSNIFLTKDIEVIGNQRLPKELVLQYAGIHEGENSLAVNISRVEQKLRQTPWVEAVSVKRILPDKFRIKIKERMPSFWVHKDGILYYANDFGEIIAPVESENFLSIGEEALSLRKYLVRCKEAIRTGALPFNMSAVSQITLSLSHGLELYLEDREIWLSFDPTDWDNNVFKIKMVFNDLIRRREMKNVRAIRVVHGNVWVVLNTRAANLTS